MLRFSVGKGGFTRFFQPFRWKNYRFRCKFCAGKTEETEEVMGILINLRYRLEYVGILIPYGVVRILPRPAIRIAGRILGEAFHLTPGVARLVRANIRCAMPELSDAEVCRIEKASLFHVAWNMLEFVWLSGRPDRIRRCYHLPEPIAEELRGCVARGERIIFVNPHLGSWEASGVMAPFYAGVDMVAIAKPVRNPYLNRLLNRGNREQVTGLEIIFSRGAIRAALKALREGRGVGTLIDQNTRVRDGGEFVNFFGLPVPSSTAPANLKSYCDAHGIPAVIIYGTSVRHPDGRIVAHSRRLSKPFQEYANAAEVLQELMQISEEYIRRYPEQYLWWYHRFQYIPPDCPPELRARYPFYAGVAKPGFFRRNVGKKTDTSEK